MIFVVQDARASTPAAQDLRTIHWEGACWMKRMGVELNVFGAKRNQLGRVAVKSAENVIELWEMVQDVLFCQRTRNMIFRTSQKKLLIDLRMN